MIGVLLSIALVLGAPVALASILFADHALAYRGTCGPYPTDIPAFPCGFGEYAINFFEPFALAGLIVLGVGAALAASGLVFVGWLVAVLVWLARARLRARVSVVRASP